MAPPFGCRLSPPKALSDDDKSRVGGDRFFRNGSGTSNQRIKSGKKGWSAASGMHEAVGMIWGGVITG
jgi:hypothetical protein